MSLAEEELRRRLQVGLPATESPRLLRQIQEERAKRLAPKSNPHKFNDEHTQELSDLWFSQRETLTVEQKDEVGLAYVAKVLGLGYKVARRFAKGDFRAYDQVGIKQSGIPVSADVSKFWKKMDEIFSGVYTKDDIQYLSTVGGIAGVLHFLHQLEIPLAEESPVLRKLAINAHVYK